MDEQPRAANDVEAWIDKLAIQELIVKYFDCATRGKWDEFETLFAPDAVYEVVPAIEGTHVYEGGHNKTVGPRMIRQASEAAVEKLDVFIQVPHGSMVTLLGDGRASATTTFQALAHQERSRDYFHYAIYYDQLVKQDGTWKFASRLAQPIYAETNPLNGTIAISRAQLRARRPETSNGSLA